MASLVLQLLVAVFKAFPSAESIFKQAIDLSAKAREAEAVRRREAKDALVDAAIDGEADGHGKSD